MWTPLILAALQTLTVQAGATQDTLPAFRPDSAALATAYADAATRDLVRRARGRHDVIDASVFRYHATSRQRISVGIRALRRDRLLYRREVAASIDWRRDGPGRVEVLGARETVPMALPGPQIPDDIEEWALSFVPEPGGDRLVLTPDGGGFAWHPLIEGGEAVYTYATGDTTEIRLPDGSAIRLVELRVTPRERDIRLITGSFWIELDGYAIVQAVFRPSREFDLERDLPVIDPGEEDDLDDVPGLLKPIRFDLRYVTVEYGLWEMRWWMPRLIAVDGSLQMGPARFAMDYEVVYDDYRVEADRHGLPSLPPVIRQLAGDSSVQARPYEPVMTVVVADSAALLDHPLLPESLYDPGASLISEAELRELHRRLDALPATPWAPERPRVTWPWQLGHGLLRYNRVEGLSAGGRVDWAMGPAAVDLTARLGTAGPVPSAELGVEVPTLRGTWRLAGYHRIASADAATRPLGFGNSLNALLFGRDDGMYFRASGAEIRRTPAPGEPRYVVRVYAERQADLDRKTQFSLRRVLDGDHGFRPNLEADAATQVGLAAGVGLDHWTDPRSFRWGAWLDLTAEAGNYTFLRPGLSLRAGFPLPGRFLAATEIAAGTTLTPGDWTTGETTAQALWYLGGPGSVRGFRGGAVAGRDHVRARAEVATALPAARLALFGDAGWAGEADAFDTADALVSAGVGASILDGLLRLDLARTIQPEHRWRLELYVDAPLF